MITTQQHDTMALTDAQLETIAGGMLLNNDGRRGNDRSGKRKRPGQGEEPSGYQSGGKWSNGGSDHTAHVSSRQNGNAEPRLPSLLN